MHRVVAAGTSPSRYPIFSLDLCRGMNGCTGGLMCVRMVCGGAAPLFPRASSDWLRATGLLFASLDINGASLLTVDGTSAAVLVFCSRGVPPTLTHCRAPCHGKLPFQNCFCWRPPCWPNRRQPMLGCSSPSRAGAPNSIRPQWPPARSGQIIARRPPRCTIAPSSCTK